MTKDSAKVTAVDAGLNTHYFTWKELSKLNKPHNAHVAYRGKVRAGVVNAFLKSSNRFISGV